MTFTITLENLSFMEQGQNEAEPGSYFKLWDRNDFANSFHDFFIFQLLIDFLIVFVDKMVK